MSRTEFRFTGTGGQGIILAASIFARAASVYEGFFALQTKQYTADMRGGEVTSDVIISPDRIIYPAIDDPGFLIALAGSSFYKYKDSLRKNGVMITDRDLVKNDLTDLDTMHFICPFSKIATNELGCSSFMNMIMLGFTFEICGIIAEGSLKSSIEDLIPENFIDVNMKALDMGIQLASDKSGE